MSFACTSSSVSLVIGISSGPREDLRLELTRALAVAVIAAGAVDDAAAAAAAGIGTVAGALVSVAVAAKGVPIEVLLAMPSVSCGWPLAMAIQRARSGHG